MVQQKQSSHVAVTRQVETTKGFIFPAFKSSALIYPLNLDNIPDSYIPPLFYLFMVSFIITTLFIYKTLTKLSSILDEILPFLKLFSFILITSFGINCLLCFLFSYFSTKIISQEYTSKHFGLCASAYTYIPLAYLLSLIDPDLLGWIATFGVVLLMSYYLQNTYSTYFPYTSQRIQVIHHIYIFLIYYLVLYGCIGSPGKILNYIK